MLIVKMPHRKCSRDNCPAQHTSRDQTTNCHRCKGQIHLLCYGINKSPGEIFVTGNIVILCDECINADFEQPSPKRKGSTPNLIQRTLDGNLSLSIPSIESQSKKNVTVQLNTQKLIETLSLELKMQTATITALKTSVDSMHDTIVQQKETVGNSIGLNDNYMSTIKKSFSDTHDLIASIKKPTFSHVVKHSLNNRNESGTPTSSRTPRNNTNSNQVKTPSVAGKSNHVIGKPLSPNQFRPNQRANQRTRPTPKKTLEKAIWISRLHRDTTEDEILDYIRDRIGIDTDGQVEIRKLVKKDRDLASYSYISFRVSCSEALFGTLIDVNKWPSTCMLREFEMEPNSSNGVRLSGGSPKVAENSSTSSNTSKNEQNLPPSNHHSPHQTGMNSHGYMETETSQVTL